MPTEEQRAEEMRAIERRNQEIALARQIAQSCVHFGIEVALAHKIAADVIEQERKA